MSMSLKDTIKPKSDQLNYDDLLTGPKTLTVKTLKQGDEQQPVHILVEEDEEPYKPCKSMRRVLISAWGDKGKDWIGKKMTLYGDSTVRFGGGEVGGIRISHLSGISEPITIKLTTSRSKRSDYVVLPLVEEQEAAQ